MMKQAAKHTKTKAPPKQYPLLVESAPPAKKRETDRPQEEEDKKDSARLPKPSGTPV